jgi:hypothetical protein
MPHTDEQPELDLENLEQESRVNFRDYPSSALVVFAALSSGVGWMLYKWMGRRRKGRNTPPKPGEIPEDLTRETKPSAEGDV